MRTKFKHFRLCLALVAFALHAMSPVISQATYAKSGKSLVEICTADGFKTIEVDEPGKSTPSLNHVLHCADCLSASNAPAVAPGEAAPLPQPGASGTVKLSHGSFAYASALRRHAQARAPPQAS